MADTAFFDYVIGLNLDSSKSIRDLKVLKKEIQNLEKSLAKVVSSKPLSDLFGGAKDRILSELEGLERKYVDAFVRMDRKAQNKILESTKQRAKKSKRGQLEIFSKLMEEELRLVEKTEKKKERILTEERARQRADIARAGQRAKALLGIEKKRLRDEEQAFSEHERKKREIAKAWAARDRGARGIPTSSALWQQYRGGLRTGPGAYQASYILPGSPHFRGDPNVIYDRPSLSPNSFMFFKPDRSVWTEQSRRKAEERKRIAKQTEKEIAMYEVAHGDDWSRELNRRKKKYDQYIQHLKRKQEERKKKDNEIIDNFKREMNASTKASQVFVSNTKKEMQVLNAKASLLRQRDRTVEGKFSALLGGGRRTGRVSSLGQENYLNRENAEYWLRRVREKERSIFAGIGGGGGGEKGEGFFSKVFSPTAIVRYLVVYRLAISVMRGFQAAARSVVRTTIELDAIQGQIAKVLPVRMRTEENLNEVIKDAITISKKYGTSVTETAQSMTLFFQQGLNVEEAMKRTDAAVRLATVSTLQLSKAVEIQTAFLKTYGSALKDAEALNDALLGVESRHAITAGTLAEAFLGTASTAEEMGVSFERLLGMITAIGVRTRDTGSKIGTALRFLLPRFLSENAVPTLEGVGVNVFGVTKEGVAVSRKMDDVIGDLTVKWNSLNKTTREYIAIMIAGRRRMNSFVTMMNSMAEEGLPATIEALTSSGRALKATDIITERLDRQIKRLGATWTGFAEDVGTRVVKPVLLDMINIGEKTITVFDKLGDAFNKFAEFTNQYMNIPKALDSIGGAGSFLIPGRAKGIIELVSTLGGLRKAEVSGRRESLAPVLANLMPAIEAFSVLAQSVGGPRSTYDFSKLIDKISELGSTAGVDGGKIRKLLEDISGTGRALSDKESLNIRNQLLEIINREIKTMEEGTDTYKKYKELQDKLGSSSIELTYSTSALSFSYSELEQVLDRVSVSLANTDEQMRKLERTGRATSSSYTDLGMRTEFYKRKVSELESELDRFTMVNIGGIRTTKAGHSAITKLKQSLSQAQAKFSPGTEITGLIRDLIAGKSVEDLIAPYFGRSLAVNDKMKAVRKALMVAQSGLSVSQRSDEFRFLQRNLSLYTKLTRESIRTQLELEDRVAAINREYKARIDLLKSQKASDKEIRSLEIEKIKKIEETRRNYGALSEEQERANSRQILDLQSMVDLTKSLNELELQRDIRLRSRAEIEQARGQGRLDIFAAGHPGVSLIKMRAKEEQRILDLKIEELETNYASGDVSKRQYSQTKNQLETEKLLLQIRTNAALKVKEITDAQESASREFDRKRTGISQRFSLEAIGVTGQREQYNIRLRQIDAEKKLLLERYEVVSSEDEERRIIGEINQLLFERTRILKELNIMSTVGKITYRGGNILSPFKSQYDISHYRGNILDRNISPIFGVSSPLSLLLKRRSLLFGEQESLTGSLLKGIGTKNEQDQSKRRLTEIRRELYNIYIELEKIKRANSGMPMGILTGFITGAGSALSASLIKRKDIRGRIKTALRQGNYKEVRRLRYELKQEDPLIVAALASGIDATMEDLTSLAMLKQGIDKNKLNTGEYARRSARFKLEQTLGATTGGVFGGGGRYAGIGASAGALAGSFIPLPYIGSIVGGIAGGIIGGLFDDTKEALIDNTLALRENTQTLENLNERILGAPSGFTMPAGVTTGLGVSGTGGSVIMISQSQLENVIRNIFNNTIPTNNNLAT